VPQVAKLLGFVGLHAAVLVPPPAEGVLADLEPLRHLGHRLALGKQAIGLPELADDLLWRMSATFQPSSSLPSRAVVEPSYHMDQFSGVRSLSAYRCRPDVGRSYSVVKELMGPRPSAASCVYCMF